MRAFLNWMVANGRLLANPLRSVKRVETRGMEKRKRRALTYDEACRFLAVAGRWQIVYLAALLTGLRRSELARLIWGNVHLDSPKPFLYAPASITKNHQEAVIWLHEELAGALRAHRPATATTADAIFPAMPSMYRLKAHLRAAGIPYIDDQGRQSDFHALRHTFGTNLSLAGVMPRVAMMAMRHSDMRLTTKTYTDISRLPTAAAIESLPGYASSGPHLGPQSLGVTCHDVTPVGTGKDHRPTTET